MRRPPRPREDALLSPRNALAILALGSLMAACCLGLFASELVRTGDLSRARSLAFLAICLSQLLYVLGIRSFSAPLRRTRLAGNPRLIVAVALGAGLQFCVLFIPVLARWFHVVPLTPADLGLAFFGSAIPLLALEVSKWARGRTPRRNNL
jgi:Ca2+-transporting ATPase